jgi:hypothetical protein
MLLRFLRVAKAFGKKNLDAAGRDVYLFADVFGERNQEFTGTRVYGEQWRARLRFAGEKDVADSAEQRRRFGKRAR